jgi:hypothetical protein
MTIYSSGATRSSKSGPGQRIAVEKRNTRCKLIRLSHPMRHTATGTTCLWRIPWDMLNFPIALDFSLE